ncbi:MAG TPA: MarR family transcriptional regulator [Thermoplasmata archaeon]|nr:MarR family transcriptional regulator [Thermoplasmata archaeon]
MRAVLGSSRHQLGEVGLTMPQAWTLSTIAMFGPLTPSELARRAALSRQAVASTLGHLERRQLVSRSHSPEDRRTVLVEVTPTAERLFARLLPKSHLVHARIDRLFSPAEARALVPWIGRIAKEMGAGEELEYFRCPMCHPGGSHARRGS